MDVNYNSNFFPSDSSRNLKLYLKIWFSGTTRIKLLLWSKRSVRVGVGFTNFAQEACRLGNRHYVINTLNMHALGMAYESAV